MCFHYCFQYNYFFPTPYIIVFEILAKLQKKETLHSPMPRSPVTKYSKHSLEVKKSIPKHFRRDPLFKHSIVFFDANSKPMSYYVTIVTIARKKWVL